MSKLDQINLSQICIFRMHKIFIGVLFVDAFSMASLQEMVEAAGEDERELAAEMAAAFLNENLPEAIFGSPKAGAGQWASIVRLINPIQGSTLDQVQLEQNEAAFR